MDYMTLKEAAEKWGVTPRRVNYYCAGGRIPGAVKTAIIKSFCEHSTLYAHAASVCRRGLRTASTKGRGLM